MLDAATELVSRMNDKLPDDMPPHRYRVEPDGDELVGRIEFIDAHEEVQSKVEWARTMDSRAREVDGSAAIRAREVAFSLRQQARDLATSRKRGFREPNHGRAGR